MIYVFETLLKVIKNVVGEMVELKNPKVVQEVVNATGVGQFQDQNQEHILEVALDHMTDIIDTEEAGIIK